MGFCYQRNFSNPTLPVDEAQFYALVRAGKWNEAIDQYRQTGEASLKRKLPAFIFQATFDETESKAGKVGAWRKQAATRLTGLVVMDIDHVENPQQLFESWGLTTTMTTKTTIAAGSDEKKLSKLSELSSKILLVYVTPSGHGLKVVFKADVSKGNLIDNQHAMAKVLGVEVDESCKDASRMSFICKESDILYMDKELFTYENKEFAERYNALYRDGHSQGSFKGTDSTASKEVAAGCADDKSRVNPCNPCQELKWRGYDIQSIIDQRYADKLPCAEDSNRHKESLKLATDLLLMLDGDKKLVQRIVETQPWVKEIIEERDENVAQTVESAAGCVAEKEKKYASSLPSKAMLEAVRKVTGKDYREVVKSLDQTTPGPSYSGGEINRLLDQWGAEIEEMFEDFPVLKDVCAGLKRSQYPAAVFVAGGTAMTLMTRCWYRFYHRPQQERRLNCSLFIIGHPASNKSMADDIYEILSAPIADADKPGLLALNRYKKDTKKKAANKEGKDKPQGIIRIHPARTSNGQLIQDMLNAKDIVEGKEIQLHMLTFDTELDNSIMLQSGGSWINKQAMELKAFHNEKDGQMYQNSDSPVDEFRVTWNYIYTGTPIALKKKVNEKNFGSGLSTRLAVIPMPKTNFEMMAFEEQKAIDWQRLERMKTWAFKLDTRFGELPLWPLVKRLYDWTKDRMADCAEDDSEANELMLKRVPYHALNYAAPFIDMRHFDHLHLVGKYWEGTYEVDDTDWKLCELIARIQYATQQHFFGVLAEKYFDDMNSDVQVTGSRHRQKSVDGYNRLPEEFTKEDVIHCFGYKGDSSAFVKIKRLMDKGLIEKYEETDKDGYVCTKYRKLSKMGL